MGKQQNSGVEHGIFFEIRFFLVEKGSIFFSKQCSLWRKIRGRPAVAVHFFNDFTLKKSTVVGLQAS